MGIPQEILRRLATPCLVIDLAAADRNIARAAEHFARSRVKLRPHFKAHKMTALMRRQIAAGTCSGVTCATAYEAQVLADEGFDDILVANQVADPAGLEALAAAARRVRLSVAVDCARQVDMLEATAARHDVRFGVLIEIDVGMGRCGLNPGSDALILLAERIERTGRLEFLGLQGYEGHVMLREDRAVRRTMAWQAQQVLRAEQARLENGGYVCRIVSGGGTGTYDVASEIGVLSEIQAGSYVLMDASYGALDLPFENALFCCATLISRRAPDAGVLNAGLKSLSAELGMPKAAGADLSVIKLSDEHARITLDRATPLAVGDPVALVPAHIDPTLNLHDVVAVWEGGDTIDHWTVDGRRRPSTRLAEPA